MTTKDAVRALLERGEAEIAAGQSTPHEQVETEMRRKWLLGA